MGIVGGRGRYKDDGLVHKSFDVKEYLAKAHPRLGFGSGFCPA